MEGRYVLIRIFGENKSLDKIDFTSGEILNRFDDIEDIIKSKYYLREDRISDRVKSGKKLNLNFDKKTAREDIIKNDRIILNGVLNNTGLVYNFYTNDLDKETKSKLIKGDFNSRPRPISFITLNTKYTGTPNSEYEMFMKIFREINLNSLDIKD